MPALVLRPVDLEEPSAALLARVMSEELAELYGDGGPWEQLETGALHPAAVGLHASEGLTPITVYGHFPEDPRVLRFALDV